jgi:hypothetical protein
MIPTFRQNLLSSFTQKMDVTSSSEMLVPGYLTTWHRIPGDRNHDTILYSILEPQTHKLLETFQFLGGAFVEIIFKTVLFLLVHPSAQRICKLLGQFPWGIFILISLGYCECLNELRCISSELLEILVKLHM